MNSTRKTVAPESLLPRRRFFRYCFLIAAMLPLAACGVKKLPAEKIRLGGTYRIPVTTEITTVDPVDGDGTVWSIGSQVYEGLVAYSRDQAHVEPLLAEYYEVTDTTLIFDLRPGVQFHDNPCFPGGLGRELIAADVKYSFERLFLPHQFLDLRYEPIAGLEAFHDGDADEIVGIQVLGRYRLKITLEAPDPDFLNTLALHNYFIIAPEAVAYYGDEFKLHPVGTGPFRFSEIVPNEKMVLVKNETYWQEHEGVPLPYLDAVEYHIYQPGEDEKILLDFQTGKIDECSPAVAHLVKKFAKQSQNGELNFTGPLQANRVKLVKDQIFRKLRYVETLEPNEQVRRAMSFAINRKRLTDNQDNPFQMFHIAKGLLPPDSPYFNGDITGQFYDPDRARQLLRDAGYPGGRGLPQYTLISLPSPDVGLIVDDLAKVGIMVVPKDPYPGWRLRMNRGDPTLLVRLVNTATSPEAQDIFPAFYQPECKSDSSLARLYREWNRDRSRRRDKALLSKIEQAISHLAPVLFLYHIDGDFRLLQGNVRGRQIGNGLGHKLHFVWLDHEEPF